MSVEEIPADELVVMTDLFHRAFKTHDCDPLCHYCFKAISVGVKFKLATVIDNGVSENDSSMNSTFTHTTEVMLCEDCTSEMFSLRSLQRQKEYERRRAGGGGCFRINGKIVH